MRIVLLGIIVLAIAAILSACASAPRSPTAAPSADQIAMMTLSQRAALIKHEDPINRVEILLGEPVLTIRPKQYDGLAMHDRYYAISSDLVLLVRYVDPIDYFDKSVADGFYDKFPRAFEVDKHKYSVINQVAMQNGYPGWMVLRRPLMVARGQDQLHWDQGALFAFMAFRNIDEGKKTEYDPGATQQEIDRLFEKQKSILGEIKEGPPR